MILILKKLISTEATIIGIVSNILKAINAFGLNLIGFTKTSPLSFHTTKFDFKEKKEKKKKKKKKTQNLKILGAVWIYCFHNL